MHPWPLSVGISPHFLNVLIILEAVDSTICKFLQLRHWEKTVLRVFLHWTICSHGYFQSGELHLSLLVKDWASWECSIFTHPWLYRLLPTNLFTCGLFQFYLFFFFLFQSFWAFHNIPGGLLPLFQPVWSVLCVKCVLTKKIMNGLCSIVNWRS